MTAKIGLSHSMAVAIAIYVHLTIYATKKSKYFRPYSAGLMSGKEAIGSIGLPDRVVFGQAELFI